MMSYEIQATVQNSTYYTSTLTVKRIQNIPESELGVCGQVLDCREVENGPAKGMNLR